MAGMKFGLCHLDHSNYYLSHKISVEKAKAPTSSIPDDHIDRRRSALFLARSVLGGYLDGRHQYLFDVIAKRQQHQRYRRPFRRVMNLRGSWQTTTQPLSRLSGNSATATVFRIAAKHPTVARGPPPPSLYHPDLSAGGRGGCTAQHVAGVT